MATRYWTVLSVRRPDRGVYERVGRVDLPVMDAIERFETLLADRRHEDPTAVPDGMEVIAVEVSSAADDVTAIASGRVHLDALRIALDG